MPVLPPHPDLDQLHRQAKDLLRDARRGETAALDRLATAAGPTAAPTTAKPALATAQLALAQEYGFASWRKLTAEVGRRITLDSGDLDGLTSLLAQDPSAAVAALERWCDHPLGAAPLNYVAMLRYDTDRKIWRDVPGTADMASALLAAGAPVDGHHDESETPLMTAASYGDAEVAKVLVAAGADLEAVASPTAGGVPGGTPLLHAAVFGMTDVVDVLVAAGARVEGVVLAAAAGDVTGHLDADTPASDRLLALIMAAHHQRIEVIDRLVAAGTPVDAVDEVWGRQALRTAAGDGRAESVRRLLSHGADPSLRDGKGRSALDLCRAGREQHPDGRGYDEVEALLVPLTPAR
jgi:ankyrin repeat protein